MFKVSGLWRMGTMLVIGIVIGVFISLKYISPMTSDIKIGRIVIKGRGNTVTDAVDISKADEVIEDKSKRKFRLFKRK